ncbi:hypothetical protein A3K63_04870 [Candidatus Micrarchaeota archaeon RBG_16_49_10]|nr:MAG: hypothetical protein A3K63_04870 [Candidatus Micrarchaeota archaeon RBG_16_49_10]
MAGSPKLSPQIEMAKSPTIPMHRSQEQPSERRLTAINANPAVHALPVHQGCTTQYAYIALWTHLLTPLSALLMKEKRPLPASN